MAVAIGFLLLGVLLLYLGAEWLVKGAAGLARELGLTPLVIGLTVVAYGTSAPELVVSSIAALAGEGELALGNIVGSNIANLTLILGATALVSPILAERGLLRWELPVMMVMTAAIPLLLLDGSVTRGEAIVLLTAMLAFTVITIRKGAAIATSRDAVALIEKDAEVAGAPGGTGVLRLGGIAAVGLGLLLGGGKVFVMGATDLALLLGMSPRTVGLTVVAVGTSLPELAASMVAAARGHGGIAVGNVIGSNIFNVMFVLGGAGVIRPVHGSVDQLRIGLVALGVITVIAVIQLRKQRMIGRVEGGLMVASYCAFLAVLAALD
jgi:cation:H+ antiporter